MSLQTTRLALDPSAALLRSAVGEPALALPWRNWSRTMQTIRLRETSICLEVFLASICRYVPEVLFLRCSWRASVTICLRFLSWGAPGEHLALCA
jgi:hypothetical protein